MAWTGQVRRSRGLRPPCDRGVRRGARRPRRAAGRRRGRRRR
jgi:hypothetical protein